MAEIHLTPDLPEMYESRAKAQGTTSRVVFKDGFAVKTPLEPVYGKLLIREKKLMSRLPPSPHVMPLVRDENAMPIGNNEEIWMPELTAVEVSDEGGVSVNDLETAHLITFANDITAGLTHLHENGIVHGDLRPASTFCYEDADGEVRFLIGDLGYAAVVEDKVGFGATDKVLSGHNVYDDLERADKSLDMHLPYATDQYAAACIIAAAIEGQSDYTQPGYSENSPRGSIEIFYDMSKFTPKIAEVLKKAGAIYRADRYSSVEEFGRELITAMQDEWYEIIVARESVNL